MCICHFIKYFDFWYFDKLVKRENNRLSTHSTCQEPELSLSYCSARPEKTIHFCQLEMKEEVIVDVNHILLSMNWLFSNVRRSHSRTKCLIDWILLGARYDKIHIHHSASSKVLRSTYALVQHFDPNFSSHSCRKWDMLHLFDTECHLASIVYFILNFESEETFCMERNTARARDWNVFTVQNMKIFCL